MRPLDPNKTKILFLTKYVCQSSIDFAGPVGERYAGLYFSFMERFGKDYRFFWHSGQDGRTYKYKPAASTLQPMLSSAKNAHLALIKFLVSFCARNFKSRKIFVVSYPYFPNSLLLAVLLLVLRPFRLLVVVDVQDLPRETPGTIGHLLWQIVDRLYRCHAYFIVNSFECMKLYRRRIRDRVTIIPMAAHHKLVTPKPSGDIRTGLTVGYIGTIGKARGFPALIEIVKNLRQQGYAIDLVINGSNPENMDLGKFSWLRLYEPQPLSSLAELLRTIDVGVIPYIDKEYWDRMSITKMATYMAAGLPIVCMHLTETSKIIAKWDCGISVTDWDGMIVALKQLYEDKLLCERLGANSRRAAVEEYNWAKQVERLGTCIADLG